VVAKIAKRFLPTVSWMQGLQAELASRERDWVKVVR
jgi:hypothetical protein